ncbi:MAG: hypothetical protein V7727_02100, partial [Sneathiella sp.]
DRHDPAIGRIEREVKKFWKSIENNEAPDPNFQADAATIAALYGDVYGGTVLDRCDDEYFSTVVKRYASARAAEKAAKLHKIAAKSEILTLIDGAETILTDGFYINRKNNFRVHARQDKETADIIELEVPAKISELPELAPEIPLIHRKSIF